MAERDMKGWVVLVYICCFLGFVAQGFLSYLDFQSVPATPHKKHYDYTFRHFVLLTMVATPLLMFILIFFEKLIDFACFSRSSEEWTEQELVRRKIIRNTFQASSELATCLLSIFLFIFSYMLIMELESRVLEIPTDKCDEVRRKDETDDCVTSKEYIRELVAGIICIITSLLFSFTLLHQMIRGKAHYLTLMNPRYPDVEAQAENQRLLANG